MSREKGTAWKKISGRREREKAGVAGIKKIPLQWEVVYTECLFLSQRSTKRIKKQMRLQSVRVAQNAWALLKVEDLSQWHKG